MSFAILAAVILPYFGLSRTLTAQNPDYLTPQLRQEVNQLKRDALAQPTNPQNVVDRGLILWQWINAYALTGAPVPVNATQDLRFVWVLSDARQQSSPPSEPVNLRALVKNVDDLIYEFRIKDETPKAIPTIRADKTGPFPASSLQTFDQTITIGEMPMNPGGTLMLGRMLMSDAGPPQNANPASNNYVTIRSSNPGARFTKTGSSQCDDSSGHRHASVQRNRQRAAYPRIARRPACGFDLHSVGEPAGADGRRGRLCRSRQSSAGRLLLHPPDAARRRACLVVTRLGGRRAGSVASSSGFASTAELPA